MKKGILKSSIVIAVIAAFLGGCGSSGKMYMSETKYEAAYDNAAPAESYDYGYAVSNTAAAADYEYSEAAAADPYYEEGAAKAQGLMEENANASNRKLIKTVDMYVETEDYDNLLINLAKQITELGGYIEYQYDYNGRMYSEYNDNRNANWEIRIPVAKLDEFVHQVGEEANVIDKTERITDVTLQYVDLESHKKALLTEQKRLLEILEQAESVEDIITIEQRLSEVRYELESMESQLRMLDNKIDYSTINLNIQEVKRVVRVEEKTVLDRIRNGFAKTLYDLGDGAVNLFVWFVVNIPYFVIWAVVIAAAVIIIRVILKKRKAKKLKKMQKLSEEAKKYEAEIMQNNVVKENPAYAKENLKNTKDSVNDTEESVKGAENEPK